MIEIPNSGIMTSDTSLFHDVIPFPLQISVHLLLLATNLLPVLIFFKSKDSDKRSRQTKMADRRNSVENINCFRNNSILQELADYIALYCCLTEVVCSVISVFFLFTSRYHDPLSQLGRQTCTGLQVVSICRQLVKAGLVTSTNVIIIIYCFRRMFPHTNMKTSQGLAQTLHHPRKTMTIAFLIIFIVFSCSLPTSCLQVKVEPLDLQSCPNQILQNSTDIREFLFFWMFLSQNMITFITFVSSLLIFFISMVILERRPGAFRELLLLPSKNFSVCASLAFSFFHHLFWMPVLVSCYPF